MSFFKPGLIEDKMEQNSLYVGQFISAVPSDITSLSSCS